MITPLHSDSGHKVTRIRDTSATDIAVDPAPALKRRRYQLIGDQRSAFSDQQKHW